MQGAGGICPLSAAAVAAAAWQASARLQAWATPLACAVQGRCSVQVRANAGDDALLLHPRRLAEAGPQHVPDLRGEPSAHAGNIARGPFTARIVQTPARRTRMYCFKACAAGERAGGEEGAAARARARAQEARRGAQDRRGGRGGRARKRRGRGRRRRRCGAGRPVRFWMPESLLGGCGSSGPVHSRASRARDCKVLARLLGPSSPGACELRVALAASSRSSQSQHKHSVCLSPSRRQRARAVAPAAAAARAAEDARTKREQLAAAAEARMARLQTVAQQQQLWCCRLPRPGCCASVG